MKHQFMLFARSLRHHPGFFYGSFLSAFFSVEFVLGIISRSKDGKALEPLVVFFLAVVLLMWATILTTAWRDRHRYE